MLRPVTDSHWRPHHEPVGQTGSTIRPILFIAVGISGAIQHLAGENGSKTIVVINKDPEAPFFKAADYGVIGDAMTIVPKLNEAVKRFKANNEPEKFLDGEPANYPPAFVLLCTK